MTKSNFIKKKVGNDDKLRVIVKFNYGRYFDREIMKNTIIYVKDDHNKEIMKNLLSCHTWLATFNVFLEKLTEETNNAKETNFKGSKYNIF